MSTPVRLLAFAGVLVLALLAGLGLGRAVGPVGADSGTAAAHGSADAGGHDDGAGDGHGDDGDAAHAEGSEDSEGHGEGHGGLPTGVTGLAVSEDGYTLRLQETTRPLGEAELRFSVTGPDGDPVTAFDPTHERDLHLVVVRRDTTGFQHLHPTMGDDGTWSIPLVLDRPGPYRVYADFAPAGLPARTLATDVVVAGAYEPEPLPEPTADTAVDGYTVELTGGLDDGEVAFRVSRDGEPVDDLQPYLGAGGHLVVLRDGDLGYLHVHPEGDDATGPEIPFAVEAPSPGRYRLFLQFQHDDAVRTVSFTVETEEAS